MFAFVSAPLDTSSFPLGSLANTNLSNGNGRDMSALLKLVEVLPQTKLKSLKCAVARIVRLSVNAR